MAIFGTIVEVSPFYLYGGQVFGVLVLVSFIFEAKHVVYYQYMKKQYKFNPYWLFLSAGSMGIGMTIFQLSLAGSSRCTSKYPHWFEGHAIWHVLCSLSAISYYQYACSEQQQAPQLTKTNDIVEETIDLNIDGFFDIEDGGMKQANDEADDSVVTA